MVTIFSSKKLSDFYQFNYYFCVSHLVYQSIKLINSRTGQIMFYAAKIVYDVQRLHKTRFMFPNVPLCNINHLTGKKCLLMICYSNIQIHELEK